MKKNNALPKLTDLEARIEKLLSLPKIKCDDYKDFTEAEKRVFEQRIQTVYSDLKGTAKDEFSEKISDILPADTKKMIWETNHHNITSIIYKLMNENGKMPPISFISKELGLSRQTIHKHLKDYKDSPLFKGQIEQFRFMAPMLLSKVFNYAVNGDMRAAKLYFQIIGASPDLPGAGNTFVNNLTNNIQFNSLTVDQQTVKMLGPEQINQIEEILKTALAAPAKTDNFNM